MEVVPFSRELIEAVLRADGLHFLRDEDGDFTVEFGRDDETGRDIRVWIMASGSNNTVLQMNCTTATEFGRADWGRILLLCNTWNSEKRWPKVFLSAKDFETSETARIVCEFQMNFEAGCFLELLQETIDLAIAATVGFWTWMHKEQGL